MSLNLCLIFPPVDGTDGSAKQAEEACPQQRKKSAQKSEVLGDGEGFRASLVSGWSGQWDEKRGGEEVREAMGGQAGLCLMATVRTLLFIPGIVGAWALFYGQSSVEGLGAREQ